VTAATTGRPKVSVIIPARNEAATIGGVLDRIFAAVRLPCEVLIIVDADDDCTRPVARDYAAAEPRLSCLVSSYGPGPANAIRFGIDSAGGDVAVVTMADGCDDPRQIDDLAALVRRGVVLAAASRYAACGQQVGGPLLKGLLSRTAGRSLRLLARTGINDATNSFKAYSTAFVREVGIDSRQGFTIGIELTAKARRLRLPVAELPTIWLDRRAGESSFRLAAWLPDYLRWYRLCFGRELTVARLRSRCASVAAPPAAAVAGRLS
jgi:dolichol-phosphate mannosyltransferase